MKSYKLGLVSISFRQHSPDEILKAIVNAGLSCVEWGSDIHAPCHNIKRLEEIVLLQKKYGVECCSYGTYFRLGQTPMSELSSYIHAAKILGTNILRLWCGVKNGQDMTFDEREELLNICKEAALIAEENQVILCMECHHGTFTQYPEDAVWLMKNVNSQAFRMYWQPFQWLDTEGSLSVAQTISPYVEHIHVFNWHGGERYSLTEGMSDWQTYLSVFDTSKTLLLEFMPDDNIQTLKKESQALKNIIGGIS